MEKSNTKAKIIITVVVLLSTLAFVALGTFAWYTLSTRGEANGIGVSMVRTGDEWPFEFIEQRDDDGLNWATIGQVWDAASRSEGDGWGKHVTLGAVHYRDENWEIATKSADDCYQLRPISTSDLQTWYLPEYNSKGEVSYLSKATFSAVANVNRYTPTASETGKDIPSNYLYYFDLWVRTLSDEHDYDLHLNNPFSVADQTKFDYDENFFGTYVLPALVEGNGGNATENKAGYDMSTCLRIGFAVYDTDPDDITKATISDFWIYEPNCDKRAKSFEDFGRGQVNSYEFQKGYVYVLDNDNDKTVESQTSLLDGKDYPTLLPYIREGDAYQSFKDIDEGVAEADKKTIKQLSSYWKTPISNEDVRQGKIDGSYIATIGGFTNRATGKENLRGIDTPTMATIHKGVPVHIRVFIWMEGQDVDCWNSSLAGSLKIGLEFRGDEADGS